MRIHTTEQLLELLDAIVARSARGDRSAREAADFWAATLTGEGHPLNTELPDENLVDWYDRGLLGDLDGARGLDVGCGNGRNTRWLAERGAAVHGVDLAAGLLDRIRPMLPERVVATALDVLRDDLPEGPFDLVYDSGCFHHVAPHRRATYLERVLSRLGPGGRFGIVTFAQEHQPSADDAEVLTSGDMAGGASFLLADLEAIFGSRLKSVELRPVRTGVSGAFGAGFLNAALFRREPA
ncbi:MAG: class I SAM-dependent methyltransferase [Polyangiaceae bacterium]|nr:class I SAM-dependent methyltransferase [Polyangiaceae bacterium]